MTKEGGEKNGATVGDWLTIRLGRRHTDTVVGINWHRQYVCLKADISRVAGVPLETIPLTPLGSQFAVVLMKKNWSRMYFLMPREDWPEEKYFEHAEHLMALKGIREAD